MEMLGGKAAVVTGVRKALAPPSPKDWPPSGVPSALLARLNVGCDYFRRAAHASAMPRSQSILKRELARAGSFGTP